MAISLSVSGNLNLVCLNRGFGYSPGEAKNPAVGHGDGGNAEIEPFDGGFFQQRLVGALLLNRN